MAQPAFLPAGGVELAYRVALAGLPRQAKYLVLEAQAPHPDLPAALIAEIPTALSGLHLVPARLGRTHWAVLPEGPGQLTYLSDPLINVPGPGLGAPMRRLMRWLQASRADPPLGVFLTMLAPCLMPPSATGHTPIHVSAGPDLLLTFQTSTDAGRKPGPSPRNRAHGIWL